MIFDDVLFNIPIYAEDKTLFSKCDQLVAAAWVLFQFKKNLTCTTWFKSKWVYPSGKIVFKDESVAIHLKIEFRLFIVSIIKVDC